MEDKRLKVGASSENPGEEGKHFLDGTVTTSLRHFAFLLLNCTTNEQKSRFWKYENSILKGNL